MVVDGIVSLGRACRITYNLRRHFDFGEAFPFDWWVSSPAAIGAALDATSDPYRDGNLREAPGGSGIDVIKTVDHGIRLQHEFPRDYRTAGFPVLPGWHAHVPAARERFLYLRDKLLSLNAPGKSLLFVRHGDSYSGAGQGLDGLIEAVARVFDQAEVAFLFVNCGAYRPARPDVRRLEFDETDSDWKGEFPEFREAFAALPIALRDPLRKRFSEINSVEYDDLAGQRLA